ncbi:uncharacterized protein LOC106516025 isoform X2 [Austrofundulus limnaeus]|uniref:Uncharacterized protein LOC106516025 isoform X2 n=1 Tax=Austrofundulus limnaeus TaxID=52670 RepID=A0A2I4B1M4_AUSLI|nr:PREDICTED: uncharacterized protein LOC106516025 isoform X2 [Austrofundulus limnaeus]
MGPPFSTGFGSIVGITEGRVQGKPDQPRHSFLLKAENQSLPLCFNIDEETTLKLFHHPSSQLLIVGQPNKDSDSGFGLITVHLQNSEIQINGNGIVTGPTGSTGPDQITAGSVTVTKRDKEIDVVSDDMHILILVHEKHGKNFLWPVLKQRPSANNTEGILAVKPVDYEVKPQSSQLKIHGQVFPSISYFAVDNSVSPPALTQCWLVDPDLVLQRPLDEFLLHSKHVG